jgi:hypothetical protein
MRALIFGIIICPMLLMYIYTYTSSWSKDKIMTKEFLGRFGFKSWKCVLLPRSMTLQTRTHGRKHFLNLTKGYTRIMRVKCLNAVIISSFFSEGLSQTIIFLWLRYMICHWTRGSNLTLSLYHSQHTLTCAVQYMNFSIFYAHASDPEYVELKKNGPTYVKWADFCTTYDESAQAV